MKPTVFKQFPILVFLAMLLAAAACGTLELGIERTPTPLLGLTATVSAIRLENERLATLVAMPTATLSAPGRTPGASNTHSIASPTPTPAPPRFSNLRFSTQPESDQSQRYFVAGIPRVYAIWDYANLADGMIMRRVWRRNGEIYAERAETWDTARYGSTGTIAGIPIYDDETGLPEGVYSLTLYIDDAVQDIGNGSQPEAGLSFWLLKPDVSYPVGSPDRLQTALVEAGGRLVVEDVNGNQRVLAVSQEISGLAWLPDSQHLVFVERDRTRQVSERRDWGITHKVWIIDTQTTERNLIGASGENFHTPVVSPTGRYIAMLSGHTLQDECQASPILVVLKLDEDYKREAVFTVYDFGNLPFSDDPDLKVIYPDLGRLPVRWENENRLSVYLRWTCLQSEINPEGNYRFDLNQMLATRQ